jgi:hypothetical protein
LIGVIAGVSSAGRAAKQKEIQAAAVQREGEANPENIRADLQELRVVIESWAQTEAVPVGTEVTWEKIKDTMIPGSRLAQSNGLDRLGHPYVLGRVGGPRAEVAAETKQAFVGKVATGFWEQASAPPGQSPTPAPASPTPAGSSQPL